MFIHYRAIAVASGLKNYIFPIRSWWYSNVVGLRPSDYAATEWYPATPGSNSGSADRTTADENATDSSIDTENCVSTVISCNSIQRDWYSGRKFGEWDTNTLVVPRCLTVHMGVESQTNSKVARVIEKYDLEGMGEQLEAEWTGEYGQRTSLRDLADEFNQAVLEAAITRSGNTVSETDLQSTYQTLTGDDIPSADKMRKERELDSMGVDTDEIQSDFVTHQAVHTYLTNYRGAELAEKSDNTERQAETLERLQGRTSAVTKSAIEELSPGDESPYDVLVDVRVICSDCGAEYTATDLLRRGGCDCHNA